MCKCLKLIAFWCRFRHGFSASNIVFLALLFLQSSAFADASVTLAWNPANSLTIAGYNIYYGGVSGVYTNKISVGKATTEATISGLIQGAIYCFVATTYSASGVESARSSQLVYLVPVFVNQPPTLGAISNLTVIENAGLQTVSLSDITSGSTTENQTLAVTATSSTTNLIFNPAVSYISGKTNGSLSFTPVHNANGTVIITVTVDDGQARNNTVTRTFMVTVLPGGGGHPALINQLTNQVAVAGQTRTFSVTSSNGSPMTCQWKYNGSNLPSPTGPVLTLSNITTNQAGIYSVTASSGSDSTTSTATLTVYPTAMVALTPAVHASGQYSFAVAGVPGCKYEVQASTNLINWTPMQTNTAPFTFVDTNAGKFSRRFYRSVFIP